MSFQTAGKQLVDRLERGLYEFAKDVMRESLVECPISGPDTYVTTWGTSFRTINGRIVEFEDAGEDPIVGDEGTLRRSSRVFPPVRSPDGASVTVGYGFGDEVNPAGRRAREYAIPVHERHELRHNPPTKSGYLIDPLLANAPRMGEALAVSAREGGSGGAMGELAGTEEGDLA